MFVNRHWSSPVYGSPVSWGKLNRLPPNPMPAPSGLVTERDWLSWARPSALVIQTIKMASVEPHCAPHTHTHTEKTWCCSVNNIVQWFVYWGLKHSSILDNAMSIYKVLSCGHVGFCSASALNEVYTWVISAVVTAQSTGVCGALIVVAAECTFVSVQSNIALHYQNPCSISTVW